VLPRRGRESVSQGQTSRPGMSSAPLAHARVGILYRARGASHRAGCRIREPPDVGWHDAVWPTAHLSGVNQPPSLTARITMAKSVRVLSENESGRNTRFVDTATNRQMSRQEFVQQIR